MNQFQTKQNQWQHKQCTTCNKQWPTKTHLNNNHMYALDVNMINTTLSYSQLTMTWTQVLFLLAYKT